MNLHLLFASLAAALSLGTAAQAVPTKVACVGDSITFGSGLKPGDARYPQVLGTLMGPDFDVRGFGNPGKTAATIRAKWAAGTAAPRNTSNPWNSRRTFTSATWASTIRAAGGTPSCSPRL